VAAYALADPLGGLFWGLALASLIGLPLYAGSLRGRAYALFGFIVLLLSLPGAIVMHERLLAWLAPDGARLTNTAFVYSMAAASVHLASLVKPRLRGALFRALVSIPGMAFIAAGALSGVWLLALLPVRALFGALDWRSALAAMRWLDLVPFVIAALSIVTSLRLAREVVRIRLARTDDDGPATVMRVPLERYRGRPPEPLSSRPLRIVQISDPHLGPWQSVAALRRRIAELCTHEPDLVLLTGDFLTMEGRGTPGALADALAPLHDLAGRTFAILGNHDHESLEEVSSGLARNRISLLVDDEAAVETPAGSVQIIGADYVGKGRKEHLERLLARYPRRADHLRLLLLHDPLGFRFVPRGEADLTLSGHTHGGQLGLVSMGLDWTVLARSAWPDHGLFGHGRNRLYVHRGTGFYGFPLRIGVPGEASLLELVFE
jgi:predicted MPP superfamily phosphohydrolase